MQSPTTSWNKCKQRLNLPCQQWWLQWGLDVFHRICQLQPCEGWSCGWVSTWIWEPASFHFKFNLGEKHEMNVKPKQQQSGSKVFTNVYCWVIRLETSILSTDQDTFMTAAPACISTKVYHFHLCARNKSPCTHYDMDYCTTCHPCLCLSNSRHSVSWAIGEGWAWEEMNDTCRPQNLIQF